MMSYSDTNSSSSTMTSAPNSAVSGIYEGSALADKTFYGFKLTKDGDCNVEIIDQSSSDIIKLPESEYILDSDDYKHWIWSSDTIEFYFNESNGHLIMKTI